MAELVLSISHHRPNILMCLGIQIHDKRHTTACLVDFRLSTKSLAIPAWKVSFVVKLCTSCKRQTCQHLVLKQ